MIGLKDSRQFAYERHNQNQSRHVQVIFPAPWASYK